MQILKELEVLIPPLTSEEFKQLERNILEEGIRDPLVTWNGILVDGHNRYRIAQEYDIDFVTVEKEFADMNAVKEWMVNNQLGRRNLPEFVRGELLSYVRDLLKEKGKEKQILTLNKGKESPVLSTIDKTEHNTQKEFADKIGWSTGKVAMFDIVKSKAPEEIKVKLRTGEVSINQAYKEIKKEEKEINFIEKKKKFNKEILHDDKYKAKFIIGNSIDILNNNVFEPISLFLSDPPYGMDFKSGFDYDNKWDKIDNDKIEDTLIVLDKVFEASKKHLKDDAHIYIFGNPNEIEKIKPVFNKYFKLKNILIWDREVIGMGDLKTYGRSYDIVLFGYNETWKDLNGNRDRDILRFNRVSPNNLTHPTEKPLEILEYLIKKSSNEGDYILDPFAGSFSTCKAAKNINRHSYGIELQEKYLPNGR